MAVTEGQLISDGTAVWKVKKIGSEVPAGTMQMFAGNTIPAGWLLCDGSAVSRKNYAKLFSAIGTVYGAGDGSTTFALPNLVGRFVEGSATAGTYKDAGLPNISGSTIVACRTDYVESGALKAKRGTGSIYGVFSNSSSISTMNFVDAGLMFNASKSNSIYGGSDTVQPPALTMLPIIKF